MRWEAAELEGVLERIWDLHDKLSDAIHTLSRARFLRSLRCSPGSGESKTAANRGFVVIKGAPDPSAEPDDSATEARSLGAIRAALEDLEDQLEFFHTVQSQQQAERDAAIARLEQSRILLAMRLAEHQGKKYRVIEEALAFVGEVHSKGGRFVAPEDVYQPQTSNDRADEIRGPSPGAVLRMLSYSFALARNSVRLDKIGSLLGNAAVFTVSMITFLQLHRVVFRRNVPALQYHGAKKYNGRSSGKDRSLQQLEVLSARG